MRLHDTMTRGLQEVEPLESGHIRMYTCGPTVYARAHIGNFRTFVFEDVLRRWLERRFDRVTHVMNLTDVEDKIMRNATASGRTLDEETAPHIAGFFEDLDALGIRRAHHYPRATQYIDRMVELIEELGRRGLTYGSEGSIYFRISAFPAYGRLSGAQARELAANASGRVDADEYDKDDARDFALWKAAGPGEIGWDTRLGRGRPGWHIECSAMSMALLGESFDLHCGGVDNIFPHHENEIAQSEGATGRPLAQLWCHAAFLLIQDEKMAKSTGNFVTLRELLDRGVRASTLRYLLAAKAHYRRQLNLSDDVLHDSAESVHRIAAFSDRLAELSGDAVTGEPGDVSTATVAALDVPASELTRLVAQTRGAFAASMDDDLNLPEAMGQVMSCLRDANRLLDHGATTPGDIDALRALLQDVDDVLGVLPLVAAERAAAPTEEEQALLDRRCAARRARDWAASDRLRQELRSRGIAVEDTAAGQRWRRG